MGKISKFVLLATCLLSLQSLPVSAQVDMIVNSAEGLTDGNAWVGALQFGGFSVPPETEEDRKAQAKCRQTEFKESESIFNACRAADLKEKSVELERVVSGAYSAIAAICATACATSLTGVGAAVSGPAITACEYGTSYGGPTADAVATYFLQAESKNKWTAPVAAFIKDYAMGFIAIGGANLATNHLLKFLGIDWRELQALGPKLGATEQQVSKAVMDNAHKYTENTKKIAELTQELDETTDPARVKELNDKLAKLNGEQEQLQKDFDQGMKEWDQTDTKQKEVAEGKKKKEASMACARTIYNTAMSAIRAHNGRVAVVSARADRREVLNSEVDSLSLKKDHQSETLPTKTGGGGQLANRGDVGSNRGTGKAGPKLDCTTALTCAQSGATAGLAQIYKDFEQVTNRPITDVYDKMLKGADPVVAAAITAENALGPTGLEVMSDARKIAGPMAKKALAQVAKDPQYKKELQASFNFDSSPTRRPASARSSDADQFQSMLAALMPKQPGQAAGAPGPRPGYRGPAANTPERGVTEEPSRSLFEIVGNRYGSVHQKFLSGQTVMTNPADSDFSVIPKNPYLK